MCNLYRAKRAGAEIAAIVGAVEPAFAFTGEKDFYPKSKAPVVIERDGGRTLRLHTISWSSSLPGSALVRVTELF